MAAEPRTFLFKVKFFRNINSVRSEIVEVPRGESKLKVLLKIVMGSFVVPACLFINACLHGLLLCESAVGEVLRSCKLFIHQHCVNELPMAGASLTRSAGTYDPIFLFRHFVTAQVGRER